MTPFRLLCPHLLPFSSQVQLRVFLNTFTPKSVMFTGVPDDPTHLEGGIPNIEALGASLMLRTFYQGGVYEGTNSMPPSSTVPPGAGALPPPGGPPSRRSAKNPYDTAKRRNSEYVGQAPEDDLRLQEALERKNTLYAPPNAAPPGPTPRRPDELRRSSSSSAFASKPARKPSRRIAAPLPPRPAPPPPPEPKPTPPPPPAPEGQEQRLAAIEAMTKEQVRVGRG